MEDCVHRDALPAYDPYDSYERLFVAENVDKQSYLDRMTHFDFKTLLPALLQVEDRMSMAHGLESRVPFLDRELVEFSGHHSRQHQVQKRNDEVYSALGHEPVCAGAGHEPHGQDGLPDALCRMGKRRVPRDFICDTLSTTKARQREYVDNAKVISKINGEGAFSRSLWGFFCLELWQQIFHDKANEYRERLNTV